MSTGIQIIGWITAILLGAGSMFSIVVFYQTTYEFNNVESSIYTGCHRIAWSFFISWVITVCVTENSRKTIKTILKCVTILLELLAFINKFLSWKAFVPLSRLTYCSYLVNGIIEIYHKGTIRQELILSNFDLVIDHPTCILGCLYYIIYF